jgi:hypothetical protein
MTSNQAARLRQRISLPGMPRVLHCRAVADASTQVQGLIRSDGSGLATFKVEYTCICMRLWPEEVVDAEVEQVTSYGIRCKVGPFRIFVSERVRHTSSGPHKAAGACCAAALPCVCVPARRDAQCVHIFAWQRSPAKRSLAQSQGACLMALARIRLRSSHTNATRGSLRAEHAGRVRPAQRQQPGRMGQ